MQFSVPSCCYSLYFTPHHFVLKHPQYNNHTKQQIYRSVCFNLNVLDIRREDKKHSELKSSKHSLN
jgi:hypothetical protein